MITFLKSSLPNLQSPGPESNILVLKLQFQTREHRIYDLLFLPREIFSAETFKLTFVTKKTKKQKKKPLTSFC
jgi:hypothetical protein